MRRIMCETNRRFWYLAISAFKPVDPQFHSSCQTQLCQIDLASGDDGRDATKNDRTTCNINATNRTALLCFSENKIKLYRTFQTIVIYFWVHQISIRLASICWDWKWLIAKKPRKCCTYQNATIQTRKNHIVNGAHCKPIWPLRYNRWE